VLAGDIVVRERGRRRGLFAAMSPGALLDIPAGGGAQTAALLKLGYKVFSVDLFPPRDRAPGASWILADANQPIPLGGSVFDYVLSREGIEHLENQMGFLRECARVLKPGGTIVLTTPSLMHLSARFSLFLTGQRNLRRGLVNEIQTLRVAHGSRIYHGHAFPLDYFRARYMLRLAGFAKIEVFTDRFSPTAIAAAPLVPLLYAAMKFSAAQAARRSRKRGETPPRDDVTREIIGHVLSPALLFGKRMIIVAEKAAA